MKLTKRILAFVIVAAQFNLKFTPVTEETLSDAQFEYFRRVVKMKKDAVLDLHETAMKIIKDNHKKGYYTT